MLSDISLSVANIKSMSGILDRYTRWMFYSNSEASASEFTPLEAGNTLLCG